MIELPDDFDRISPPGDRRHRTPERWIAIAAILIAGASSTCSAFHTYGNDDKATSNRITALETHQGEADKRMERIENKIDRLLERFK